MLEQCGCRSASRRTRRRAAVCRRRYPSSIQGPTSINRYDRERQATVAADLVGTAALGDATKKIYVFRYEELAERRQGQPSGDAESLNELSEGFATAIHAA